MRRHSHWTQQPAWWPEGESWPPRGGPGAEAWNHWGRNMFGRVIGFVLFALVMAAVAGGIAVMLFSRIALAELLPLLVVLAVVLMVFGFVARRIRRSFLPVQDLVRSAGRLADGDYSARVDSNAAGAMQSVAASFNAMADRLEQSDTQRRQLMADLSHELRNPLAVIRGELEAIVDGVRPSDQVQLGSLLDEVGTMERLIDDLGLLTKSEAGTLTLEREPLDLAELVEDVAAAYRPAATDAGVDVIVDAPAVIQVEVDPVRIRQALSNLVVNALRAMEDGTLTLGVRSDGASAVVEIADTGAGIDPDHLDSVFDRFVKSADSPGAGLGLPIARGLARAHGGDLTIAESSPAGTTMALTLPLA